MKLPKEIQRTKIRKYSIVIFGPAKFGKTESFKTMYYWMRDTHQPYKRIYLYDFDNGGYESLNRVAATENWVDDLDIFQYKIKGGDRISESVTPGRAMDKMNEFMKEFNSLYDHVDQNTGDWKEDFKAEAPGIVIIDSFTAIIQVVTDYVLLMRGKDMFDQTWNEQNAYKAKLLEIIDSAKDLPCHCAFIAHEEPRLRTASAGNPDIDAVAVGGAETVPVVNGALRWTLTQNFDVAFQAIAGYKWQTASTGTVKGLGCRTATVLKPQIPQDFREVFNKGVVTLAEIAAREEALKVQLKRVPKPTTAAPIVSAPVVASAGAATPVVAPVTGKPASNVVSINGAAKPAAAPVVAPASAPASSTKVTSTTVGGAQSEPTPKPTPAPVVAPATPALSPALVSQPVVPNKQPDAVSAPAQTPEQLTDSPTVPTEK